MTQENDKILVWILLRATDVGIVIGLKTNESKKIVWNMQMS